MYQLHRSDKCSCADLKFDIQTTPTKDGNLRWHGIISSALFYGTRLLCENIIQLRTHCQFVVVTLTSTARSLGVGQTL